jgi:hypothetical protein
LSFLRGSHFSLKNDYGRLQRTKIDFNVESYR